MNEFTLEHGELQRARDEIRRVTEELTTGQRRIDSSFGGFLGAGWTGLAADSFSEGWATWHEGVTDVLAALGTMADLLDQTDVQYATADTAVEAGMHQQSTRLEERLG